jgi:hypothetical protein
MNKATTILKGTEMTKNLFTSLVILLAVSNTALDAKSAFDKAASWTQEKAHWAKEKAHLAKDKIKNALRPETRTVKELAINVTKVVGGGTAIVFGCYLAHANLFMQRNFELRNTLVGLLGVAMVLGGIPFFLDGAKDLTEKKINFSAIADDARSYSINKN